MSARSRRKGAAWERTVAKKLRDIGIPAERNLEEVRTGNTGDIKLDHDIPLVIQCKTGARPPIYQGLDQAIEAARESAKIPVAVIHRDGTNSAEPAQELAVIRLDHFIEIVEQLKTFVWR